MSTAIVAAGAGASITVQSSRRRVHRVVFAAAVVTYVGVVWGGAVTSTESGLADRHGVGFGGRVFPSFTDMARDSGLFVEHGHRIVMWCVGFLTLAAAYVAWRHESRAWVRRLALSAPFVVLVPATLGALAVARKLHPAISLTHVTFAMLFLSLLSTLAIVTGSWWARAQVDDRLRNFDGVPRLAVGVLCVVFVQIIFGGIARHATQERGGATLVMIGNAVHISWAFVVFALVLLLAGKVLGGLSGRHELLRPALLLLLLLVVQLFLGFAAFLTQDKSPGPVVEEGGLVATGHRVVVSSVHQATGVLMLLVTLVLALRTLRLGSLLRSSESAADGQGAV